MDTSLTDKEERDLDYLSIDYLYMIDNLISIS